MSKCTLHPGRDAVTTVFGKEYCSVCRTGIAAARAQIDRHVEPKDCFIWYASNDNWQPIPGTGCAHWVAHTLNLSAGTGGARCLAGLTCRVHPLVQSRTPIHRVADVQLNDIWTSSSEDHTGLVIRIVPSTQPNGTPTITIRHDSSRQGKVAENEFATYFHGQGLFYR